MQIAIITSNEAERLSGLVKAAVAESVMVIDAESYEQAAKNLGAVRAAIKEVEDVKKHYTQQMDATKKQFMQTFDDLYLTALDEAKAALLSEITHYDEEQRRKRAAEQAALEKRLRDEANAKAEAAAFEALKQGKDKTAEMIIEVAAKEVIAVPQLAEAKPIPNTGIHYKDAWKFEIQDPTKLPAMFLMPDEKAIRAFVVSKKDQAVIPGVKIWVEKIPIQRGYHD